MHLFALSLNPDDFSPQLIWINDGLLYMILVGNPEGKRTRRRPRRRMVDNIKTDFRGIGWD
jgi:hypothetical protein